MSTTIADERDLAGIIESYHGVTERLEHSHSLLRSEVCRLREELFQKNRELRRRERLAALGEMAAGVAHEIRNPLGGIGLYASLLERDLTDYPEQLEIVRRMSVGVRNMEGIIGDILAFAGEVEPDRRRVCLGEVLDSALTQAAPRVEVLDVEIEVDMRLTSRHVFCDVNQIERALLNLIINALEAAGPHGRVWIRAGETSMDDGLTAIVIEDNGPGVKPDVSEQVFNPFFTTKGSGTGLGLAIVHRIAEANGGRIALTERRGGGAAFVLFLPMATATPAANQMEDKS